jgi:hypothetical protein
MVKLLSMFILALIPFFFNGSYNVIIDLLNYIMGAVAPAVVHVVGLFPANPCGSLIASCSDAVMSLPKPDPTLLMKCLGVLNWLLPVAFLAQLVGCIMLTVMIYFTMAPVARWLKLLT